MPGLLRAERGIRPRRPPDPGRRTATTGRGQRSEGLDQPRADLRLDDAARPHRSERREAQGAHLLPPRHALAGRSPCARSARSPATPSSTRCSSRTSACRRRTCSAARGRRVAGGPHDAHVRAAGARVRAPGPVRDRHRRDARAGPPDVTGGSAGGHGTRCCASGSRSWSSTTPCSSTRRSARSRSSCGARYRGPRPPRERSGGATATRRCRTSPRSSGPLRAQLVLGSPWAVDRRLTGTTRSSGRGANSIEGGTHGDPAEHPGRACARPAEGLANTMDFGFSQEQEPLRQTARSFLEKECPSGFVRRMMDDPAGTTDEFWGKLAELGWLGLIYPEAHGGVGLDSSTSRWSSRRWGAPSCPARSSRPCSSAGSRCSNAGSEAQKAAWLPRIAAGEARATLALLEESARWDAAGVAVTAKPGKGGGFVLSGTKLFVPDGQRGGPPRRGGADGTPHEGGIPRTASASSWFGRTEGIAARCCRRWTRRGSSPR